MNKTCDIAEAVPWWALILALLVAVVGENYFSGVHKGAEGPLVCFTLLMTWVFWFAGWVAVFFSVVKTLLAVDEMGD